MTTLTIPKEVSKEKDLVVIPKRVYLKFLHGQKKAAKLSELPSPPKNVRYFKPTKQELKALERARKDFSEGRYLSLEEFNQKVNRWLSK